MDVKQIYTLANNISSEVLGKSDLLKEDLSNVVDFGTEVLNANAMDSYVKSLVNHIGKVIFVNRAYTGSAPSVFMDSWEFGSILEKVQAELPNARENKSWELEDGTSYSQDTFYKPKVTAKFYNSSTTFEIPISITEKQVKQSFSSAEQLNGFYSMIFAAVDKSMTLKVDGLIMRTINNMTAAVLSADGEAFENGYSTNSTVRCVNLLKLYNDEYGTKLTAEKCLTSPDFIKYASYYMGKYVDRLKSISTLFNVGGKARFTPTDMLRTVLLTDFAKAAQTYLYSDTFNRGDVLLPNAETVPFWQTSGTAYSFDDVSGISVKNDAATIDITISGILGVMFDRDALGVVNSERRVTTSYNAAAEFYNNYFKFDCGYFNDTNENFVVFFVA